MSEDNKEVSVVPRGPDRIFLSAGHAVKLKDAGLIGDESLFSFPNSKDQYANIEVDALLKNENLIKNSLVPFSGSSDESEKNMKVPAQDAFFGILLQELLQNDTSLQLNILSRPPLKSLFYTPKPSKSVEQKLQSLEDNIKNEYWEAQAVSKLLDHLDGPESEYKSQVRERVGKVLERDEEGNIVSLDDKIKKVMSLARQAK